jgi:hypothetical protein
MQRNTTLRYEKALSERIYLLTAFQFRQDHWIFNVRGQSNNVYRQEIFPNHYNCSCPDYAIRKSFCKHLLFLISRVANTPDMARNLCINSIKWDSNKFDTCVANWLNRLRGRLDDNNHESSSDTNNAFNNAVNNDCSICFEEMKNGEIFSQCITTCKNYFHESCLKLWINSGHNTCPLCRATWVEKNQRTDDIYEIDRNHVGIILLEDRNTQDNHHNNHNDNNNDNESEAETESDTDSDIHTHGTNQEETLQEEALQEEAPQEDTTNKIQIKSNVDKTSVKELCNVHWYHYTQLYYEFIKPEIVHENRKFILVDKELINNKHNMIKGDIVKEMLGLIINDNQKTNPIYLQDYYVFINCTSTNKILNAEQKYINVR